MIPDMMMDSRFWTQLASATSVCIIVSMLTGCNQKDTSPPGTLNTIKVFSQSGTQRGQFVYPRGMDVFMDNGHPKAVIVDKTARIQVLDLESGAVLGSVHTPKWDRGKPTGVSVATSALNADTLAVYIADTHEHRVLMYELPLPDVQVPVPTEPDLVFGSFGEDPGQFIYPTDVAVQTDDAGTVTHLYVSEYGGNDRISRFQVDRTTDQIELIYEYQIGVVGEEVDASDFPTALSRPQSIELWTNPTTAQQEIIVTDASHHRVGRLSIKGELIVWFGDPMDTSEDAFRFPYGITVLDDATMIITEFGGNRIRCLDIESGDTLWRYGVGGRSVGQLAQPWDCGVIGDELVILDSGNSRVQICKLPAGVSKIGNEYADTRQSSGGSTP